MGRLLRKYQIFFELTLLAWIWAAAFIGVRFIAEEIPATIGAGIRYLIASLFFMIFLMGRVPRLNVRQWVGISFAGLAGVFGYNYAFFTALQTVPAAEAAIFMSIMPALTALASVVLLKERLLWPGWVGILFALIGELFIVRLDAALYLDSGHLFLLLSIVSFIIYGMIVKKLLPSLPPLPMVSLISIIGTLMIGLSLLLFQENLVSQVTAIRPQVWLVLLSLGIFATAIGNFLYYRGIQKLGLIKTAYFINLIPLFAALQGSLLLDETLTKELMLGGFLIVAGVFLVVSQKAESR